MKSIIGLICVFVVGFLLITSCTRKNSDTQANGMNSKINLRFMWWGGAARHEATLASIQRYIELHPNITISAEYGGYDDYFQKLATQLAGNAAPDLIQMDTMWFTDLMSQGDLFADIEKLPINITPFDAEFLNKCRRQGVLVGLPASLSNEETLIINTDFFSRYNLDASAEIDWSQLLEWGRTINSRNKEDYLFALIPARANALMRVYISQLIGDSFVSDDYEVLIDEEAAANMLSYLLRMFETGTALPFDEAVTITSVAESSQWLNSHIGMDLESTGPITTVMKNSSFPIGFMRMPIAGNAKDTGIEIRVGQILSINKTSAHITETSAFLEWFLTDPESVLLLKDCRGVPAVESARNLLMQRGLIEPIIIQMNELAMSMPGKDKTDLSFNAEVEKIFDDTMAAVAYKQLTPAKGASEMVAKLKAKVTELKQNRR
jgi:oligogalacturonide transport system substrate-binding protein